MRNIILFFFLFSIVFSFAQTLQTGEKLSYAVQYGEEAYDFTLKVQQLSPEITFDYALTASTAMIGTVNIDKKAQKTAVKMHNDFSQEEKQLNLKEEISVFPSEVMVAALTNGKPIQLDAGKGMKTFKAGDTKKINITHYTLEGTAVKANLSTLDAKELVSADGSEHVWISNSLGQAIIVEMDLGWTIKINEWISPMPLNDKPQEWLGKLLTAADMKALALRVCKSSYIHIEDLSDKNGPDVYKEYFCPMEGIRMETRNDTLTDVLFYTEGYEHEEFIWRGYDGTFASGINLNMTYQQIDNTVGKPSEPRWPTDVMIVYPQQRMIVYYGMPRNDKDKKAIANAKINFLEFE